jgi:hypothetical protein
MDITTIVREQRGGNYDLEEGMPECFRTHVSLSSQIQNTLSPHSSTIKLAETALFLASNNLLNGSSLVKSVKKTLDSDGDQFFKQLFKLKSSTVQSFTSRLLESLSSIVAADNHELLQRLVRYGLDHGILSGPTGGRCLQLAIWHCNFQLR